MTLLAEESAFYIRRPTWTIHFVGYPVTYLKAALERRVMIDSVGLALVFYPCFYATFLVRFTRKFPIILRKSRDRKSEARGCARSKVVTEARPRLGKLLQGFAYFKPKSSLWWFFYSVNLALESNICVHFWCFQPSWNQVIISRPRIHFFLRIRVRLGQHLPCCDFRSDYVSEPENAIKWHTTRCNKCGMSTSNRDWWFFLHQPEIWPT